MKAESMTPNNPGADIGQGYTIEIKSRDAAGNITEHVRINPDGTEDKII